MHIAVAVDKERRLHEHGMLRRLIDAMIAAEHKVTLIAPDSIDVKAFKPEDLPKNSHIFRTISFPLEILFWQRRSRTELLAGSFKSSPPDIVYASGRSCWAPASDLARRLERPLALDIWSADLVRAAWRGKRYTHIAAYVAPTAPIGDALREYVAEDLISVAPFGVLTTATRTNVLTTPDALISLAVIGAGRDVASYRAMLQGLGRIVHDYPSVHAFVELRGPGQHEIWRHIHRLDLLPYVSTITDAATVRSLLHQCDVLVMPERYGEMRSLTLEFMASGVPVIAADDPFLDMLHPDETAFVIEDSEADDWANQFRRAFSSTDTAREIGAHGRQLVLDRYSVEKQAQALLETFRRMQHGDTYTFNESP